MVITLMLRASFTFPVAALWGWNELGLSYFVFCTNSFSGNITTPSGFLFFCFFGWWGVGRNHPSFPQYLCCPRPQGYMWLKPGQSNSPSWVETHSNKRQLGLSHEKGALRVMVSKFLRPKSSELPWLPLSPRLVIQFFFQTSGLPWHPFVLT